MFIFIRYIFNKSIAMNSRFQHDICFELLQTKKVLKSWKFVNKLNAGNFLIELNLDCVVPFIFMNYHFSSVHMREMRERACVYLYVIEPCVGIRLVLYSVHTSCLNFNFSRLTTQQIDARLIRQFENVDGKNSRGHCRSILHWCVGPGPSPGQATDSNQLLNWL